MAPLLQPRVKESFEAMQQRVLAMLREDFAKKLGAELELNKKDRKTIDEALRRQAEAIATIFSRSEEAQLPRKLTPESVANEALTINELAYLSHFLQPPYLEGHPAVDAIDVAGDSVRRACGKALKERMKPMQTWSIKSAKDFRKLTYATVEGLLSKDPPVYTPATFLRASPDALLQKSKEIGLDGHISDFCSLVNAHREESQPRGNNEDFNTYQNRIKFFIPEKLNEAPSENFEYLNSLSRLEKRHHALKQLQAMEKPGHALREYILLVEQFEQRLHALGDTTPDAALYTKFMETATWKCSAFPFADAPEKRIEFEDKILRDMQKRAIALLAEAKKDYKEHSRALPFDQAVYEYRHCYPGDVERILQQERELFIEKDIPALKEKVKERLQKERLEAPPDLTARATPTRKPDLAALGIVDMHEHGAPAATPAQHTEYRGKA